MLVSVRLAFDVKNHIDLLAERGMDVGELRQRFGALSKELPEAQREDSDAWGRLEKDVLAADEAWDTGEPNALEDILAARPANRTDTHDAVPGADALADKVAGGWVGRIAGCILGKPVECLMHEPASRAKLKELLTASGDWPLKA